MSKKSLKTLLALTIAGLSGSAAACGSQPYIGEVCTFAITYCPIGYAEADGRLLSIAQNQALFALLGTTYGGNGQTTFALPDLRGRNPIGVGVGPGLAPVDLGEISGQENVTLFQPNMPFHSHAANTIVTAKLHAVNSNGNSTNPSGKFPAVSANRDNIYSNSPANAELATDAVTVNASTTVGASGESHPFSVRNPYVGMRYCVATVGIFPGRE
ncbi:phage tail protein [Methylococcaceae bacterium WWC4]|nr:phage tail protein [Methylococcaceae bacterium WWC4]